MKSIDRDDAYFRGLNFGKKEFDRERLLDQMKESLDKKKNKQRNR